MSKIKLTNDTVLDFSSVGMGINTNNVIASGGRSSYTATQDCFACLCSFHGNSDIWWYLNGKELGEFRSGDGGSFWNRHTVCLYLKKGDRISTNSGDVRYCWIYGLK